MRAFSSKEETSPPGWQWLFQATEKLVGVMEASPHTMSSLRETYSFYTSVGDREGEVSIQNSPLPSEGFPGPPQPRGTFHHSLTVCGSLHTQGLSCQNTPVPFLIWTTIQPSKPISKSPLHSLFGSPQLHTPPSTPALSTLGFVCPCPA